MRIVRPKGVLKRGTSRRGSIRGFFFVLLVSTGAVFARSPGGTVHLSPDLEIVKLSDNAYVHVSWSQLPKFGRFASNGLVFINGGEAFLFDTPADDSLTKTLVAWIRDSLKVKIVGFMPNHWHADCMGGLRYLQSVGIETYAHQMTVDIAKSRNLPVPTHGFRDSLRLFLGDKAILCWYPGPAHSLDNIVAWIPSERILFAGCMAKSMDSKNLGNTADGDTAGYPKTIDKVIGKFPDAKIVIPGHGAVGGLELLRHTRELAGK
jgi:metallo-beta-lactamase class B